MHEKKLTTTALLNLPTGTLVRIKDDVDCCLIYKKGGELVFQSEEGKEKAFGIKTLLGTNYAFNSDDYVLTDEVVPLEDGELQIIQNDMIFFPAIMTIREFPRE